MKNTTHQAERAQHTPAEVEAMSIAQAITDAVNIAIESKGSSLRFKDSMRDKIAIRLGEVFRRRERACARLHDPASALAAAREALEDACSMLEHAKTEFERLAHFHESEGNPMGALGPRSYATVIGHRLHSIKARAALAKLTPETQTQP